MITQDEQWYITEKELDGFNPDGPNFSEDDGSITVALGTVLRLDDFSEYCLDFEIIETGQKVALHRMRVCYDVGSPRYYDNYFAPVDGLKKIK